MSMDTQLQNFWIENINKEASLRFAWHLKYSKQFAKTAAKQGRIECGIKPTRKTGLSFNSSVSERIKKIQGGKKLVSSAPSNHEGQERKDKATGKHMRCGSAGSNQVHGDMRPPSQNTRGILYNGISAHGEGRYAYLKKRKQLTPEQKFNFPILSSCQYGWKILEYANPKPSAYARTCVIKDSFYRNSGIMFG